jgi:hypothetical protein
MLGAGGGSAGFTGGGKAASTCGFDAGGGAGAATVSAGFDG